MVLLGPVYVTQSRASQPPLVTVYPLRDDEYDPSLGTPCTPLTQPCRLHPVLARSLIITVVTSR